MAPPVYKMVTNRDYFKRPQYYEESAYKSMTTDPQFLNIGYVQRLGFTEAWDREVIRELGNEDIAFDLEMGIAGSGELQYRMVDPTFAQWCMKLASGAGTPDRSIQMMECCKVDGVDSYALSKGILPTRFSLVYARFIDVSASFFVGDVGDYLSLAELKTALTTGAGDPKFAVPITASPWSNLSGGTQEPFKINSGSGLVSYDNISFNMDINRGLAQNQPSGYDRAKDAAITSREITGTWTTPVANNGLVDLHKDRTSCHVEILLKAGSTPCVLSLEGWKVNTYPRVVELGNANIRAYTFNWQAQTATLSDYVPTP